MSQNNTHPHKLNENIKKAFQNHNPFNYGISARRNTKHFEIEGRISTKITELWKNENKAKIMKIKFNKHKELDKLLVQNYFVWDCMRKVVGLPGLPDYEEYVKELVDPIDDYGVTYEMRQKFKKINPYNDYRYKRVSYNSFKNCLDYLKKIDESYYADNKNNKHKSYTKIAKNIYDKYRNHKIIKGTKKDKMTFYENELKKINEKIQQRSYKMRKAKQKNTERYKRGQKRRGGSTENIKKYIENLEKIESKNIECIKKLAGLSPINEGDNDYRFIRFTFDDYNKCHENIKNNSAILEYLVQIQHDINEDNKLKYYEDYKNWLESKINESQNNYNNKQKELLLNDKQKKDLCNNLYELIRWLKYKHKIGILNTTYKNMYNKFLDCWNLLKNNFNNENIEKLLGLIKQFNEKIFKSYNKYKNKNNEHKRTMINIMILLKSIMGILKNNLNNNSGKIKNNINTKIRNNINRKIRNNINKKPYKNTSKHNNLYSL